MRLQILAIALSNPQKMMDDFEKTGFHISLWQYLTLRQKQVFLQIIDKNLNVKNAKEEMPYENAVLRFLQSWRTCEMVCGWGPAILRMGVGAVEVNWRSSAVGRMYTSGRGGWYEHNLYPLRYNKDRGKCDQKHQQRKYYLGSQRLGRQSAISATLGRWCSQQKCGYGVGLQVVCTLDLVDFRWSSGSGGFVQSSPEDLYRRWFSFRFLTSAVVRAEHHLRSHGCRRKFGENFHSRPKWNTNLCLMCMHKLNTAPKLVCQWCGHYFVEFPDSPGASNVKMRYLLTIFYVAPWWKMEKPSCLSSGW